MQPISILKPLKGVDSGLVDNLRSFFVLDYPDYEILFSVADGDDPAVAVVHQLCAAYPQVPTRLLISSERVGLNPKVNNLVEAYDRAGHDWILISDSNVRVNPDYLGQLAAVFAKDVGVVTAAVAGRAPQFLGGNLEAAFLNTHYCRWMFVAEKFGCPVVVGKSMLFRKSEANRFGGIRTLACYLAEDYMAGVAMQYLGLRVVMMNQPIGQQIGQYTVREFWSRHLRWGRIRKSQAPVAFFLEPLFGSLISAILGLIGFAILRPDDIGVFLFMHFTVWFVSDCLLMQVMARTLTVYAILAWWVREISALPMWIHIAIGNTVNWRGRQLHIRRGGILSP